MNAFGLHLGGEIKIGLTIFHSDLVMDKMLCVTVGDPYVGKTCLLMSYLSHKYPDDFIPKYKLKTMSIPLSPEMFPQNAVH